MKTYLVVNNNIIKNKIVSEDFSEIVVGPEDTLVDASSMIPVPNRFDYYLTESNTHIKLDIQIGLKSTVNKALTTGSIDFEVYYDGDEYNITDWKLQVIEDRDLGPTNISNKVFSSSGSSFTVDVDDELLSALPIEIKPWPDSFVHSTHNVVQHLKGITINKD